MLANWDTLKIFNGESWWRRCEMEPLTVKGSNCRPTNDSTFRCNPLEFQVMKRSDGKVGENDDGEVCIHLSPLTWLSFPIKNRNL